MATQHDRMQTDYTWIRGHSASDVNAKARTHGYHYLYTHAPNKFERLEMIYRSMGKQYDWELEKFRLSKKLPDRGNKKRFFKNVFRFIKNPYGYIHWATYSWRKTNPRFIVLGLWGTFLGSLILYKGYSVSVHRQNGQLLRLGKNVEGTPGQYHGYYHKKPYKEIMAIPHLLHYDLTPDMIILNQTWKQNLRKEFQLLKSYNYSL